MLFVIAIFIVSACGQQALPTLAPNTILIAMDSNSYPIMYENNGEPQGLYAKIIVKAFEKMGVEVSLRPYTWKDALVISSSGEMGIVGIEKIGEPVYDFSEPIFSEKYMLYVRKGESFAFTDMQDLKGKKIGILNGTEYGFDFETAKSDGLFTTEVSNSDSENFSKLESGKIDCVVANEYVARPLLVDGQFAGKMEVIITPLTVSNAYLAFSKSANQNDLLKKFNEILIEMKSDGSYNAIVSSPY